MPDYILTITIKDVAEGDATTVAQEIWDTHADGLDAARGDFTIGVSQMTDGGRNSWPVDWEPVT